MLTNLRDDRLTRIQDYNLLTFKIYFKFETTTDLLTHSLTRVKSRDASASKKLLDMLCIDPRGVHEGIALIFF